MTIITTNILAGPLVILVWVIDIYLFLVSIRFILTRLPKTQNGQFCQGIKLFTDPLIETVKNFLQKYIHESPPTWMVWLIVILTGIVGRHLLIWIIVSI